MHRHILQYAVSASADEWSLMSLETAALALAAYEAERGGAGPSPLWDKVGAWAASGPKAGSASIASDRMQPVLDGLLTQVAEGGCGRLASDEAAFLSAAQRIGALFPAGHWARSVPERLEPHRETIADRLRGAQSRNGIAARLSYVTARQLLESPAREISKFAGIDVAFRGPVYAATGDVKVVGSVPEQCLVAADSGSCLVEGYLMGRVAARNDCIVQENIAGTAVVREGDIRARNLVDRSVAVSKKGGVYCAKVLQPELVFAAREIAVRDEAVMGRMTARRIEVAGSLLGGFVQASEYVKAERFRQTDERPLRIVLRDRLSCEDYGESLAPHIRRMIARTNRLQREIAANRQRSATLDGEAEEAARTALLYLTGREQINQRVEELGRLQRRLSALNRTILGVDMLARTAEESLDDLFSEGREQELDGYDAIAEGDENDAQEPGYEAVVAEIRRELRLFMRASDRREHQPVERGRSRRVLAEVRTKLRDWVAERTELKRSIDALRHSMADEDKQWAGALGLPESTTLIQALHALLSRIRQNDAGDALRARAATPFMAIMLRTIAQRREKARFHRETAGRLEAELVRTTATLKQESQIDMYERDGRDDGAWAEGVFESGIRIATDPELAFEPDVPDGLTLTTTASGAVKRYVRRLEGIVEAP